MSKKDIQDHQRGNIMEWVKKPFFWVLVLTAAVIVAAVILIASLVTRDDSSHQLSPVEKTQLSASRATAAGDYPKALRILKDAEKQAKTDDEKVIIYSDIAAAAANTGDIPSAISYYAKKHELDPSSKGEDAYILGSYYERQDDKAKAATYYKEAVIYLKETKSKDTMLINSLIERIKQLEEDK